tara:strand:+ start:63 stop:758 length:696 start_codon:yes stop_codon:yes gene_type:complete
MKIPQIVWKSGPSITENLKMYFKTFEYDNFPYKVHFLDDEKSREMVKHMKDPRVLEAYDTLIPGAYKADLLRYILMYLYGGVWSDVKHELRVQLNTLIDINENLILVKDHNNGIQISFMAAVPGLKVYHDAIYAVVDNVEKRYYGKCSLCPTGPQLFSKVLRKNKNQRYKIIMKDCYSKLCDIKTKKVLVFKNHNLSPGIPYSHYMPDMHYSHLWKQRKIYKRKLYNYMIN